VTTARQRYTVPTEACAGFLTSSGGTLTKLMMAPSRAGPAGRWVSRHAGAGSRPVDQAGGGPAGGADAPRPWGAGAGSRAGCFPIFAMPCMTETLPSISSKSPRGDIEESPFPCWSRGTPAAIGDKVNGKHRSF